MARLLNLAKQRSTTTGPGTVSLDGAVLSGFLSWGDAATAANVASGTKVRYGIRDGAHSEEGEGTFSVGGTNALSRDRIIASTNGGAAISLSGNAIVFGSFNVDWVALDSVTHKGLDQASAATLNLDNATGDYEDVTGTTTVTAITLAEGRRRWFRAVTGFQLTAGASLIINGGGANVILTAGDLVQCFGYSGGVVRCYVTKASGKGVIQPNAADISDSAAFGRSMLQAATSAAGTALLDAASESAKGIIEIATLTEVKAATDALRAVVPTTLKNFLEKRLITVGDDAVGTTSLSGINGPMMIGTGSTSTARLVSIGDSQAISDLAGRNDLIAILTGVLSPGAGTDGIASISASGATLYISNRFGASVQFGIMFLNAFA